MIKTKYTKPIDLESVVLELIALVDYDIAKECKDMLEEEGGCDIVDAVEGYLIERFLS